MPRKQVQSSTPPRENAQIAEVDKLRDLRRWRQLRSQRRLYASGFGRLRAVPRIRYLFAGRITMISARRVFTVRYFYTQSVNKRTEAVGTANAAVCHIVCKDMRITALHRGDKWLIESALEPILAQGIYIRTALRVQCRTMHVIPSSARNCI